MGSELEPPDAVRHAVRLYHRGIICPAEMWFQVAGVLTPASAAGILDSLPAETRQQLRAVFADRPSLPGDSEIAPIVAAIVAWLERGRA